MALPAILGLPALVTLLVSVVSKLVDWFAKKMTRAVAIRVAYFTAFTAMLAVFVGLVQGFISGLNLLIPSEYAQAVSWVLPSNTSFCIGTIISAHICQYVFNLYVKMMDMTFQSGD